MVVNEGDSATAPKGGHLFAEGTSVESASLPDEVSCFRSTWASIKLGNEKFHSFSVASMVISPNHSLHIRGCKFKYLFIKRMYVVEYVEQICNDVRSAIIGSIRIIAITIKTRPTTK